MQLTRTINADKRYYLDEDEIQNVESLIQTMERFNHIKIQLYICLYDKSFLKRSVIRRNLQLLAEKELWNNGLL